MSRLSVFLDVACVVCVWPGHVVWTDVLSVCVWSAGVSQCTACTAGPTPIGWGPNVSLEHFISLQNL